MSTIREPGFKRCTFCNLYYPGKISEHRQQGLCSQRNYTEPDRGLIIIAIDMSDEAKNCDPIDSIMNKIFERFNVLTFLRDIIMFVPIQHGKFVWDKKYTCDCRRKDDVESTRQAISLFKREGPSQFWDGVIQLLGYMGGQMEFIGGRHISKMENLKMRAKTTLVTLSAEGNKCDDSTMARINQLITNMAHAEIPRTVEFKTFELPTKAITVPVYTKAQFRAFQENRPGAMQPQSVTITVGNATADAIQRMTVSIQIGFLRDEAFKNGRVITGGVHVLVDKSYSMMYSQGNSPTSKFQGVIDAATQVFGSSVFGPTSTISCTTFSSSSEITNVVPFSRGDSVPMTDVIQSFSKPQFGYSTSLYDAALHTARNILSGTDIAAGNKHALLIFTDGYDNSSSPASLPMFIELVKANPNLRVYLYQILGEHEQPTNVFDSILSNDEMQSTVSNIVTMQATVFNAVVSTTFELC